jgi:serine/threonine protein kinase
MRPESPLEIVEQFEQAWQQGTPPQLDLFLPPETAPSRRKDVLLELVAIDLEYRWRRDAIGGIAWELEEYVRRFPELGPLSQLSAELIAEEYRVRQRWGDRPSAEVYLRRFPTQAAALTGLLQRVDARRAGEEARRQAQPRPSLLQTPVPPHASLVSVLAAAVEGEITDAMPVSDASLPDSVTLRGPVAEQAVAGLIEMLRQGGWLTPAQFDELLCGSLDRFADVHALAGELLSRDWLTTYQVTQMLQGHGHKLTLGPYRVLERLGSGGAGEVFKARHQKMNRLAALKILHEELLTDAECVGRFLREIQLVSQLDHPNLIPAYDAGPVGQSYFLAMKYIEGTDLGRLVKKGGPLLLTQACDYIRQAALGLEHLHQHGLVHRDIKPHNLLIGRDGVVKVADLGLARGKTGETTELTGTQAALIGTTDYLAPEQALDFHTADIRADIYSLGCTFWYLLIGQPPFPARTLAEALLSHQNREPSAIEQLRPDVPPGVASVLRRMLAKRPEDRYPSPAEVAAALAPYSSAPNAPDLEFDFDPRAARWSLRAGAATTWQMLSKFARRNKVFTASVASVLVILAWSSVVNYRAWQKTEQTYQHYQEERREKERRTRQAVPAVVKAAKLLTDRRQFDDALAQANLALDYDPQCAEAQLLKGQLLIVARKEFAQAAAELDRYLALQPGDAAVQKLAALCGKSKPDDVGNLLQMAQVFEQQNVPSLADGLLTRHASTALQARMKLLELYRRRIEAAWPNLGERLEMKASGIYRLNLGYCGAQVTRLDVLEGMPLTSLLLVNCTEVRDLSPLKGMPLTGLNLGHCHELRDLSPLQGIPLASLHLTHCEQVRDLSPLQGMPLTLLALERCGLIRDFSPLKRMPLTSLSLSGTSVDDLTFLKGMPLTLLDLSHCGKVRDLSPLKGLPLTSLNLTATGVRDLSPLKGMALTSLAIPSSVGDLSPLKGMPLAYLHMEGCGVRDLSPLQGMPLTSLYLSGSSQVADLAPLKGMPLVSLSLGGTLVRDLSVLEGMNLSAITLPPEVARGMEVLRRMKELERINYGPAADFWKKFDQGEFKRYKP